LIRRTFHPEDAAKSGFGIVFVESERKNVRTPAFILIRKRQRLKFVVLLFAARAPVI
jgi:hypothetical protein